MSMSKFMDDMITGGAGSSDDERFKFNVGDKVKVKLANHQLERYPEWKPGFVGVVKTRRNGYPPPAFIGYWFPLYWIDELGEIGESCLEDDK